MKGYVPESFIEKISGATDLPPPPPPNLSDDSDSDSDFDTLPKPKPQGIKSARKVI